MVATATRTTLPPRPGTTALQRGGLLVGLVAFVTALLVEVPGLDAPGQRMLAIFLLAIVLWVTEAIPLMATAVGVILLEVLLISDQALVALPGEPLPAADYFAALANPVIVLFLGGFLIADGASKFGLDRNLAARSAHRLRRDPGARPAAPPARARHRPRVATAAQARRPLTPNGRRVDGASELRPGPTHAGTCRPRRGSAHR